jgi:hypothetical protein
MFLLFMLDPMALGSMMMVNWCNERGVLANVRCFESQSREQALGEQIMRATPGVSPLISMARNRNHRSVTVCTHVGERSTQKAKILEVG